MNNFYSGGPQFLSNIMDESLCSKNILPAHHLHDTILRSRPEPARLDRSADVHKDCGSGDARPFNWLHGRAGACRSPCEPQTRGGSGGRAMPQTRSRRYSLLKAKRNTIVAEVEMRVWCDHFCWYHHDHVVLFVSSSQSVVDVSSGRKMK